MNHTSLPLNEGIEFDPDLYRTLFEESPDGLLLLVDDRFIDCNETAARLLGYACRRDLICRRPADLSPARQPDGRNSLEKSEAMMALAFSRGSHRFEWVHSTREGEPVWLEVILTRVPMGARDAIHVIWRDIGEGKRREQELRQLARAFEVSQAIMITSPEGVIERVNPAFSTITGYPPAEAIGRTPRELLNSGRQDALFYQEMFNQLEREGYWEGELWNRRSSGEVFPSWESISTVRDHGGELEAFISVFRDISRQKELEARLEEAASHDGLTGARNRSSFEHLLDGELERLERYGNPVAVVMFDIDDFKAVNDTHGHGIGDNVLVNVVACVRHCVRATDTVARWGGEEFMVMLPETDELAARSMAERIRAGIAEHGFPVVGRVTVSLGVASARAGEGRDELVRRADKALYRAKREGRNRLC